MGIFRLIQHHRLCQLFQGDYDRQKIQWWKIALKYNIYCGLQPF